MSLDFSDDLDEQLAQLGEPLGDYGVGRWTLGLFAIGGLCLVLAGLAVVALMIDRVVWHPKVLVFGIVLVVAGVVLAIRAARIRGLQVLVFPEALLRLQGQRAQSLFWDEIETVFWKKNSGVWAQMAAGSKVIVLKTSGNKEIHLDSALKDFEHLSETIRLETLQPLFLRAVSALESGRLVDFGVLQVSRTGLRNGGERLFWGEVGELRQENEEWRIYKKGQSKKPWYKSPGAEIGNVHVLLALVNSQVGKEEAAP